MYAQVNGYLAGRHVGQRGRHEVRAEQAGITADELARGRLYGLESGHRRVDHDTDPA